MDIVRCLNTKRIRGLLMYIPPELLAVRVDIHFRVN